MSVHLFAAGQAVVSRATASLALTDDTALELIISDIPFFCVGLVAFAFFSFFLVMRRVNLISIYLYSSALSSFVAAILDLSQILVRGSSAIDSNTGVTPEITVLMNIREVGLSIGVGFRFLFFWTFVAERPRGEPPPTTNLDDPRVYLYNASNSHSAQWERWGYIGVLLKWVLLVSTLSIPILQIIWRIAARHFGVVYMVESTIEIMVSALFVMKLLLNVFLSPVTPWWRPFRFYIAPLVALGINIGLGIGELVLFLFSETALGRFLQAIEIYILILFVLIATFYKVPVRPARSRGERTSAYEVTEKKRPVDPPPVPSFAAQDYAVNGRPSRANDVTIRLSRRFSTISSRIPSWIPLSRSIRQPDIDVESQRNKSDAESGVRSPQPQPPTIVASSRGATPELLQEVIASSPTVKPEFSRPQSLLVPSPTAPTSAIDTRDSRPSVGISLSYYGMDRGSPMPYPSVPVFGDASRLGNGADSPIYGLNGIVNAGTENRVSVSVVSPRLSRSSVSSFEALIQQQAELDRSIAALRLFSPRPDASTFADAQNSTLSPNIAPNPPTNTSSNSTGRTVSTLTSSSARRDSTSGRSEFSLSIFPDPPPVDADISLPSRLSFANLRTRRSSRLSRRDIPNSFDTTSSQNVPSLPTSPIRTFPGRFGSAGTQYDVTSFIGDLTNPTSLRVSNTLRHAELSEVQSVTEVENSQLSESDSQATPTELSARPNVIDPAALPNASSSVTDPAALPDASSEPATASSGVLTSRRSSETPYLRPFLLGSVTASPTVSSPLASGVLQTRTPGIVPIGPRRPARSRVPLPSNPRPAISNPRPVPGSGSDPAPGAFERPRPSPLVLPSDSVADPTSRS